MSSPPWGSAGLPDDVVAAALAGDLVAVDRLLGWLRPALVRFCRARVAPGAGHGDADDVARDVCDAVLRGLRTFAGDPHEVLGWMYGIAAREVADHHRRGGHGTVAPALLATLTPAQREVLILRLVDGLSAMETAAVTGMSPATVRLTQHLALNLLRRHLDHPPRSG